MKIFDRATSTEVAILHLLIVKSLNVEKLPRNLSYGVMRQTDTFALLKFLPPQFVDTLGLKRMQNTQYLRKLSRNFVKFTNFDSL